MADRGRTSEPALLEAFFLNICTARAHNDGTVDQIIGLPLLRSQKAAAAEVLLAAFIVSIALAWARKLFDHTGGPGSGLRSTMTPQVAVPRCERDRHNRGVAISSQGLSIALRRRDGSARFKGGAHPASGWWMHHLEIQHPRVDGEVTGWLSEAA